MEVILEISHDPAIRDQLRFALAKNQPLAQFVHADSIEEALDMIQSNEFDIILVDVRVLPRIRHEVNELLANTTLTTKIILIESANDLLDLEPFSHLGLESVSLPLSPNKLRSVIGF